MSYPLPPPTGPHETIPYTLEDVAIQITWHYSARDQSWRIDVADETGDVIVRGRRLVPGWNPLLRVVDSRLPPGRLWFRALSEPVGRDALEDGSAVLEYLTAAEVAELVAVADAAGPQLIITID